MPKIQITEPAQRDIQDAFNWWSENRSVQQAAQWYDQIYKAFRTLEFMPERCPLVPESGLSRSGIRQLFFGIGKQPTHRLIFFNDNDADTVTILRVRHHAQDEL